MTSHRSNASKMQASSRERKRDGTSSHKEKANASTNDRPTLPLLKKSVYMDVKQGKQAKIIEEQLKKLGANVEKFLSREVNYVISSFVPLRQEERQTSTGEDNPNSPSFVPSPFSCGPSPSAPSDPKKSLVSRGKALAQIACAKNQPASGVISSAEKLGIKVVSVEAATRWLEKELKKLEKDCLKKKENSQEKEKPTKVEKKRKKIFKGPYIKFESCNRMYRPIKSELDRWPIPNTLAPPGLHPFTDVKLKMAQMNARRHLLLRNKKTGRGGIFANKMKIKRSGSRSVSKDSGSVTKPTHALPDLVGVPITTTGDVKRNIESQWKKRPDKLQGYCECCEEKFKDLNQHLNDEDHRSYARNKSNYESLDALMSEIPSRMEVIKEIVLNHCSQKQIETQAKCEENKQKDAVPPLNFNVASPISSIKTGVMFQEDTCTPQPQQDASSEASSKEVGKEGNGKSDKRPPAIVIRRPTASGIFTSPRRRQPTPSKKPWVPERSMVFRDSPMASLQLTNIFSQINFTVSEKVLSNPYLENVRKAEESKQSGSTSEACELDTDKPASKNGDGGDEEASTQDLPKLLYKSIDVEEMDEPKAEPVLSNIPAEQSALATEASSQECGISGNVLQEKNEKDEVENAVAEGIKELEMYTSAVPTLCIADGVKTRTRKCKDSAVVSDISLNISLEVINAVSEETSYSQGVPADHEKIMSGVSRKEELSTKSGKKRKSLSGGKNQKTVEEFGNEQDVSGDQVSLKGVDGFREKEETDTGSQLAISNRELESVLQHSQNPIGFERGEKDNNKRTLSEIHCDSNDNLNQVIAETGDNAVRQPKHKRRRLNKDVNRTLFVDTPDQVALGDKTMRKSSVKKVLKYNIDSETCKNNCPAITNDEDITAENQDETFESMKKHEHVISEECPSASESASSIMRENIRKCRLFAHKGMYKEDTIVIPNEVRKRRYSTPAKIVNNIEMNANSIDAVSNDDGDAVNRTVKEDKEAEVRRRKSVSRKNSKIKSYEKKIHTSVNWNQTDIGESSAFSEPFSEGSVAVPNIAERVKDRRSCTQFNHEGQYANGGEGTEELVAQQLLSSTTDRQRKFLKAKKRLLNHLNQKGKQDSDFSSICHTPVNTEESTEHTDNSTSRLSRSTSKKKSATSPAVVIRRGRPSFNALSKTDANWCKYLSDKDWSQSEESPSRPFQENAGGLISSVVASQGVESEATSNETAVEEGSGEEKTTVPVSTDVASQAECSDDRLKKIFPNTQEELTSNVMRSPRDLPPRDINDYARSPRLKLTIHRNPKDASYSSTLEEIHNEYSSPLDSPCSKESFNTKASKWEKDALALMAGTHMPDQKHLLGLQAAPVETLKRSKSKEIKDRSNFVTLTSSKAKSAQGHHKERITESGDNITCEDPSFDGVNPLKKSTGRRKSRSKSGESRLKLKRKSEEQRNCGSSSVVRDSQGLIIKDECLLEDINKDTQNATSSFESPPQVCVNDEVEDKLGILPPESDQTADDNAVKEEMIGEFDADAEKRSVKEEHKSHKFIKQTSKRKYKDREKCANGDGSPLPAKKMKYLCHVPDETSTSNNENASTENATVNNTIAQPLASHRNDSETSEVDFPKLGANNSEHNNTDVKGVRRRHSSASQRTPRKHKRSVTDSGDEAGASCKELQSDVREKNGQEPVNNNLGDILAFVPSFSSPGKTNSSWDDACDSYLSTSAISQRTPSAAQFAFSPVSHIPLEAGSSSIRSPGKRTPKKNPSKGGFLSPDILSQFSSPTKRKASTSGLENSPSIEKIDSVISFNHMSPQRLQFSPKKCEKSVSHMKNLNPS